ncbi:MAG: DUF309 domain-containing protein [Planctomycetota bacterium]|nr:MAG: DUF309 domain-containing protein [Planctomycetota bacterium]
MNDDALYESFAQPRYSSRPFPPYRFVPGRHPHPTASPLGHSYAGPGHAEPAVCPVAPDAWRVSEEYLYGCDLYNHAYWWEAHEAWEGLWHLPERGSLQRKFLQGLIQVSACHLKLRLGHMDGVSRLLESSRTYLCDVRAAVGDHRFMGLEVAGFLNRVEAYYTAVRVTADEKPGHRPELFPYCLPG